VYQYMIQTSFSYFQCQVRSQLLALILNLIELKSIHKLLLIQFNNKFQFLQMLNNQIIWFHYNKWLLYNLMWFVEHKYNKVWLFQNLHQNNNQNQFLKFSKSNDKVYYLKIYIWITLIFTNYF
jgi:hypothetical protein